jgi:ubiquinone biosynthesis protein
LIKHGFNEIGSLISRHKTGGMGATKVAGQVKSSNAVTHPQRMRLVLEELGPTFIKFGQLLSTRPDLLPVEYIAELEKLQDQVPPAKYESIREEIKKELGDFPENIFERFDTNPIAAGSIGQVYRAKTKEGLEVVVKVRRPGVVDRVKTECEILLDLAGLIKSQLIGEDETVDPHRMVHEFTLAVNKEVDFANERRNQKRFIRNFADDDNIHVPQVVDDYCSDGLLTMEYINGIRPGKVEPLINKGLDPKQVARAGADFVLKQVFTHGFFHTDPHPGNFFVLEDNILVPIDFGQVGRLGSQERRLLRDVVVAIVTGDAAQMIRGLEQAEMIGDRTEMTDFVRDAEILFDTYYGLPIKEIPFGEMIMNGFDVMRRHYINPPADFTLMLKSMVTIEAFAVSLDEEFQIIEYLKPYAKKFSVEDYLPSNVAKNARKAAVGARNLMSKLPEDINSIMSKMRKGKVQVRVHHEHLEQLSSTLDKSSNRISFAVIIGALLIGSSMLVPQEGAVLGIVDLQTLGIIGYVTAAVIGIWLVVSILRSRHF